MVEDGVDTNITGEDVIVIKWRYLSTLLSWIDENNDMLWDTHPLRMNINIKCILPIVYKKHTTKHTDTEVKYKV